jgi:hypothetical protein
MLLAELGNRIARWNAGNLVFAGVRRPKVIKMSVGRKPGGVESIGFEFEQASFLSNLSE